jgi:hypothetical protein
MMRIFADFQNGTLSGRVRLGCMGTQRDVERLGIVFLSSGSAGSSISACPPRSSFSSFCEKGL